MSLDASVTVNGWIGTQPRLIVSDKGVELTTFRLASTKRFFNRAAQEWVDGPTTWYTVKCWRGLAKNVADSLRKSDAVLVHGNLSVETWEGPEGPRTSVVIDAVALGPDLSRGLGSFRHTQRRRDPAENKDQLTDVSDAVEIDQDHAGLESDADSSGVDLHQMASESGDFDPNGQECVRDLEDQEESLTMADEIETREPINA